jgi:2-polyprenyl-6-methoxyphenol hydroxylase-like FAD-dependent oxidoreductase
VIHDVVIAGAGPVGLFLACELRLASLSVLILEAAEQSRSPLKQMPFGMRGLTVPTVEAFYRRGLLNDIISAPPQKNGDGLDASATDQKPRRQAGHFAGIPLDDSKIDRSAWAYRLAGPADSNLAADMERIETVLADRAIAMGVEIVRGCRVHDFHQSENEVIVCAGEHSYRAQWLVGCDGGRSIVRKLGGFEFVGTEPEFTGYTAHVDIADPQQLKPGRQLTSTGMYFQSQPGHLAMLEFDKGAFHRTEPITLEHLQSVLRRVSGTNATLSAVHVATSWTDRAQQATSYRRGRVLLAGDAAHIHSPLGGQGLNAGLGDAMNLGWKLAATVRGEAPEDLLDSYTAERHATGAAVLDWSRAQVEIMRPTPHARALEAILRDIIATDDGATYFAERLWGVSQRYDLGADHPVVGRSAPDFEFTDGTRLGDLFRDGTGLLLDFGAHDALRELAARYTGKLKYADKHAKDRLGLSALLIRPDGVVAWACDDEPAQHEAAHAASRWFGAQA